MSVYVKVNDSKSAVYVKRSSPEGTNSPLLLGKEHQSRSCSTCLHVSASSCWQEACSRVFAPVRPDSTMSLIALTTEPAPGLVRAESPSGRHLLFRERASFGPERRV